MPATSEGQTTNRPAPEFPIRGGGSACFIYKTFGVLTALGFLAAGLGATRRALLTFNLLAARLGASGATLFALSLLAARRATSATKEDASGRSGRKRRHTDNPHGDSTETAEHGTLQTRLLRI